jgi:hypothetical protein
MVDIGLAGKTVLTFVCLGTKGVGALYLCNLIPFEITFEYLAQIIDRERRLC